MPMFSRAVLLAFFFLSWPAAASEAENARQVRALFDAFNAHDVEAMVRLYAPDAEYVSPDVPPGTKGHAAIRTIYVELFSAIPNAKDTVVRMVAQGDTVAVEFVARGTAPAQPGSATRKFELPIASFITFNEKGQIVRDAAYFDK